MRDLITALTFSMVLSLTTVTCPGDDGPGAGSPGKVIAIARTGGIADDLYKEVADYVAAQYKAPVREGKIDAPLPPERKELTELLAAHLGEKDACLLVLTGPDAEATGQDITVLPPRRIVVLDTAVLKPGETDTEENKEKFSRRVTQEALRAIALVMGVPGCPFGRCALLRHQNDAQLDLKSRNPCPPCLAKVRKKLREAGVTPPVGTRETGPPLPGLTAPATGPAEAPRP